MKTSINTLILLFSIAITSVAQSPLIVIDGNPVLATDQGIKLPHWLKAGQTLAASTRVTALSVLEFSVGAGSLTYSQTKKITSSETVPANTTWKIESYYLDTTAAKLITSITGSGNSLSSSYNGTLASNYNHGSVTFMASTLTVTDYSFSIPAGVTQVCVTVFGGGGGGGAYTQSIGASSGAYSYKCFPVLPGRLIQGKVGRGGYSYNFSSASSGYASTLFYGTTVSITANGGYPSSNTTLPLPLATGGAVNLTGIAATFDCAPGAPNGGPNLGNGCSGVPYNNFFTTSTPPVYNGSFPGGAAPFLSTYYYYNGGDGMVLIEW